MLIFFNCQMVSFLCILYFFLSLSLSSTLLIFVQSANDSDSIDDFLRNGLHSSAPPMKAVDEYKNSCVRPKGDRLFVFTPSSTDSKKNSNYKFHKGSAFLATDLCPMGHTAKDAPLLMSWALDAEGFTHEELMNDVYHHQHHHLLNNKRKTSSSSNVNNNLRSPPLTHIIFGNMCMSKDKRIVPNKRTPVFHNVLIHWFHAVKQRLLMLRKLRSERNTASKDSNEEVGTDEIKEIHFIDIEQDNAHSNVMCFENVVVRHERWRWLREQSHADQFRIAMWNYFNVSDENQKQKLAKFRKPNSKIICSKDDSLANELIFSHLQPSKNAVMVSSVEARLKKANGGTIDNGNSNSTLLRLLHMRNLAFSLRSAFPSSLLPLRITILVRDEDRHFEEKQIAEYIEKNFGSNIVVEVKQEKFDSLKGDKRYIPPTHKEQLQILFDTDILIAAHGAGLSAVLAMRPGTAVIEFFPHNFKYSMYEELAEVARVHYRRWESQVVWPKRCCRVAPASRSAVSAVFEKPMHLNGLGARACKGCDTYVNPELIEDLVAQALREVAISHL